MGLGRVGGSYYTPHLSIKSERATFIALSFRYIRGLTLAHVVVLVTRLMYCYKIIGFPVAMFSIYVM
jgi:hypothetical protein